MDDQFEISLSAAFRENLSSAAEMHRLNATPAHEFYAAKLVMESIESIAKSLALSATISDTNKWAKEINKVPHYGGGPIVDHHVYLRITGLIAVGSRFIMDAQPIIIEYLKIHRGHLSFRHGNTSIECGCPECLEKIEAHLARWLNLPSAAAPQETHGEPLSQAPDSQTRPKRNRRKK
jgi:hypothetical protein